MSFCRRVQSSGEVILRYSKISSVYNLIFEVTFRVTKHKKRRGTSTDQVLLISPLRGNY